MSLKYFLCFSLMGTAISGNSLPSIKIGFSGSLSGHFVNYGIMISRGIMSAFQAKNEAGGIHGQPIELVSLDDHGSALETKKNITLLAKSGIQLFLGIMGTRGVLSVLDQVRQEKIAMLFPWGGNPKLNDPTLHCALNVFGLMQPQIEKLISTIVSQQKIKKIGIFHADDDFSTQAAQNCKEQLNKIGVTPAVTVSYNRYTLDLDGPTKKLLEADPKVVLCIATSSPTVKLINNFFRNGFYGVKFCGIDSTFLVPEILHDKGVNFNYVAAVPNPKTTDIPLARHFRQDLERFFPDESPTALSFTYYICAQLLIKALSQNQKTISPRNICTALEELGTQEILGFPLNFNPQNRYLFGSQTWLSHE